MAYSTPFYKPLTSFPFCFIVLSSHYPSSLIIKSLHTQALHYHNSLPTLLIPPSPGSFGTYPKTIRDELRRFQDASEARPDAFIRYDYPKLIDESREAMAKVPHLPAPTNQRKQYGN
jgi:hypothetical protein